MSLTSRLRSVVNSMIDVVAGGDDKPERRYVVLEDSEVLWFDKPMGKLKGSVDLAQCHVSLDHVVDGAGTKGHVDIAVMAKSSSVGSATVGTRVLLLRVAGVDEGKAWLAKMQTASVAEAGNVVWLRSGWLTKKGKKRFFVVAGGELQWFAKELPPTSSQTQMETERNGALEIGRHCSVSLYDAKKHGFVVTSTNPDAQYILFAATAYEMSEWIDALKEQIAADDSSDARPHERKAWLHVRGNRRYFAINQDERGWYQLRWYNTTRGRSTVTKDDKCKGSLELAHCTVLLLSHAKDKRHSFQLETRDGRKYVVDCPSEDVAKQWVQSLQYCIALSDSAVARADAEDAAEVQRIEAAAAAAAATTTAAAAGDDSSTSSSSRKSTSGSPSSGRRTRGFSAAAEPLFKRGWLSNNGKKRFAVLEQDGTFAWYEDELASAERGNSKVLLESHDCTAAVAASDRFSFIVTKDNSSKTWTLTAATASEATEWVSVLRASRKVHRVDRRNTASSSAAAPPAIEDQRRGTHSGGTLRTMSRAATMEIRRRMTHSLGQALFPERSGPLYDHFLVVGLPPNLRVRTEAEASETRAPQVLYSYPPSAPVPNEQAIAQYCFPTGVRVKLLQRTKSSSARNEILYGSLEKLEDSESSFVILITGAEHLVYGICVLKYELLNKRLSFLPADAFAEAPGAAPATRQLHDTVAPQCFLFLSRFPFFQLHFEVLYGLLARERLYGITRDMILGPDADAAPAPEAARKSAEHQEVSTASREAGSEITRMLEAYGSLKVPPDGQPLSFQLPQELRSLRFQCPPGDEDNLVANACLGALFKLVPMQTVLTLLGAATLEKQIVVVAESLGVLSAVVLALIPLLRPHVWQGAFIPIVPNSLSDAMHAPVPYIMGVPALEPDLRSAIDVVLLDVDRSQLTMPSFAIPPLPRLDALADSIRADYAQLFCDKADAKAKVLSHPFKNSLAELEIVNRILTSIKLYNVHLNDTVDANITLLRSQPGNEAKEFDLAEPDVVKQLLETVAEADYRAFLAEFCATQNFMVAHDKKRAKA
jgi:hypothetical protein